MAHADTSRRWDQVLSRIDRRFVYAGLFLFTLLPFVTRLTLPTYVTPPARRFFETVEKLPADRVVFIASDWDAGTYAENEPQSIALYRHLMRRRLRFVVFSISTPTAPQMAQGALDRAIALEFGASGRAADGYPEYGVHYVNAGYKVRTRPWIRSLVQSPPDALGSDWKGTPVRQFPLFEGLDRLPGRTSMLIDVTASDSIEDFIALVGSEKVPISLACTAVIAPEQYPLLATGQLQGMLTGMRGGAEYEVLLGDPGQAAAMMGGQSFAHLYIFLLILLGNAAIFRTWLTRGAR
jgi:hypothetical protein